MLPGSCAIQKSYKVIHEYETSEKKYFLDQLEKKKYTYFANYRKIYFANYKKFDILKF